jgi:hypothetical protein
MRCAVFLVIILGLACAQFEDTEGKLSRCQEDCCAASGGAWDGASQDCIISGMGDNSYHDCGGSCLEIAGRELESRGAGLNLCCAPAFLLISATALTVSSKAM